MDMRTPAPNSRVGRRWFFILCVLAGCVSMICGLPVRANPPNIIVILADDLGIESIGDGTYWPNGINAITPTLDRLAAQGRVFSHGRVNPKCSPTRAGLLTGRIGLHTGVTGLQVGTDPDTVRLGLQTEETTIGEALKQVGYQTLFVGKWHVGNYGPWGQQAQQQGFDIVEGHKDYQPLDDPVDVGDELVTMLADVAIDVVNNRATRELPYALFLWQLDPHGRFDHTYQDPFLWWRVDESLLPSGEPYYEPNRLDDNEVERYRAVVEAYDTELRRTLFEIGVIDADGDYLSESNTVVFFLGDNGENDKVSPWPERAKGTVYEPGIRVPFFVFGEGVPADGADSSRLVMHTDLFDTICDVVGVPAELRGDRPRDSVSFADAIGWSDPLPERAYQVLNQEDEKTSGNPYDQRVALVGTQYKLIAQAGGTKLAPLSRDEFYDLVADPQEQHDLVVEGMTPEQHTAYLTMRDAIVDYWFTAVCEPTEQMVDIPMSHAMSLVDTNDVFTRRLQLGHAYPDQVESAIEARVFYRFNTAKIDDLLPPDKTLDDVASAQVVVAFGEDSTQSIEVDTDLIQAYPVVLNWYTKQLTWGELENAYSDTVVGAVDLAPHVVWKPSDPRLSGPPMSPGTPMSLGHNSSLLELVKRWHEVPTENHGIVLIARPDMTIGGDQHVTLLPAAILRLTLK
ncbi:MAG: hypothetical protein D8M59_14020 [Planctomycetes bacterium]|nr:hypothetical protein [Planctomycetota bacterium]NOG55626.1 sulfatase-like hydrolase/transferase [Planctomycetota bacterium]